MSQTDRIIEGLSAGFVFNHETDSWVEVAGLSLEDLQELLDAFQGPSKEDQWMRELVEAEIGRMVG